MMRERSVRKAKEKAVEHLHEITSNYYKGGNNNENSTTTTPKRQNKNKTTTHETQSDDIDSDIDYNEPQTNVKSILNSRNTTTTSKQKKQNKGATSSKLDLELDNNSSKENPDLYIQILLTNTSIQVLVENWIDTYKKNQEQASIDLINFLIKSCGCRGKLSKNIFKSKEYNDAINELVDYFDTNNDEGATDYPIINTQLQFKRFKVNFTEFIQLLIQKCQHSILYDQFMLDNLLTFLICLSDSQIRAFRHTSTLCLVKIMTALIDVLLMSNVTKDALDRQYNSEKSKSQSKRALDRLENLSQKRKEMDSNEYEIQNFLNFIFKAVFIHRYRDSVTDIRTLCINELGEWMKMYPTKFLDDHFLKYIGWTLNDRQHECRLKCLQILKPLYENKTLLQKLELFTTRFKQRLIDMALDKDTDVCVNAIKLLTSIYKANDQLLEDKDCEAIYALVFHINRSIAQASGEFLYHKLFDKVKLQNEDDNDDDEDDNKPYLLLLIQFLIESELHEHPTYLIDSMWDIHQMLKDWKCMTDLLLLKEHHLDDLNEKYLIEIMTCCVKQAATGEYPVGRVQTQASKKNLQEDRNQLTIHFIQTITQLLTKYNSDDEKLLNLLQIPLYFELAQYKDRRYEKHIDSLLEILMDIYLKNINIQVLNASSLCLSYLSNEAFYNLHQKVNLKCSSIVDRLIVNFEQSMQLFSERTEVDLDELYPLIISLKRLAAFSTHHNILEHKQEIWPIVYTLIKAASTNESISFDIVDNCFNLIRSLLCWSIKKLNELSDTNEDGVVTTPEYNDLMDDVRKMSRKYYRIVNKLFVHDNKQIEEEAYFELCDLLLLLNQNLESTCPNLNDLIIDVQPTDINMLLMYCVNNVFETDVNITATNEDENDVTITNGSVDKIEKLHKKRCILAAFSKLVMYNTVPMRYMAEICRGYSKYATSYGDIVKQTLNCCRDISKVLTSKLISLTLQRELNDLINNYQRNNEDEDEFFELEEYYQFKELAKKFQQFIYGSTLNELNKSREALIEFHIESINYCNDSKNLQAIRFFDLLKDFTNKLNNNDKRQILVYLNKKEISGKANKNDYLWESYFDYRDSLIAITNEVTVAGDGDGQVVAAQKQIKSNKNSVKTNEPVLSSTVLNPPGSTIKRKINLSEISSIDEPRVKIQSKNLQTKKRSRSPPPEEDNDDDDDGDESDSIVADSTIKSFDNTLTLSSAGKENENLPTPKRSRITRSSIASSKSIL